MEQNRSFRHCVGHFLARVPHALHAFGVIILAEQRRRRDAAVEGIAGRQTTLHAPGGWSLPAAGRHRQTRSALFDHLVGAAK
jgi:hypothetical protein